MNDIMNLTKIIRRFTPRQFGLLAGIFCIIGLFSALQISSSVLLSVSLRDAQHNEQRNQMAYMQQAKVDQARISLLAASDLLNRAGVYFMQDKETGSDGSWHSLMDEAQQALRDSQQAWQAWQTQRFALVITDCHMPGMDGFALARAIRADPRADAARVPIIALTASVLDSTRQACLDAGIDHFIAKPVDRQALHATLAAVLMPLDLSVRQ